jgi:RecA/RadA recombinase
MLQAALPKKQLGLESNVLYINTVKAFPERRKEQMLFKHKLSKKVIGEVNSRIFIMDVQYDQFESFLNEIETRIIQNVIKVIIIDSIAALSDVQFINDNNEVDYTARSLFLKK